MTKAAEQVVTGYVRLTSTDRNDAIAALNRLIQAPSDQKRRIEESYVARAGLDLGPTGQGSCPCCGK